jgi:Mg/Co/Ni transporter MgtE
MTRREFSAYARILAEAAVIGAFLGAVLGTVVFGAVAMGWIQ